MFKFKMVHWVIDTSELSTTNQTAGNLKEPRWELHCVRNVKSQDLSKQAQDKGSATFANFDNFSVKTLKINWNL